MFTEGSNLSEKDSSETNFTLSKSTTDMTSTNFAQRSNLSEKDSPETNFTLSKSTTDMTSTMFTEGSNLSEKDSPNNTFTSELSNYSKTKKIKKMKNTISAISRQKPWVITLEHTFMVNYKTTKNDFLNRNEICDLMLWSQAELTWYITHAGLPVFGNKISRSVLRKWEAINVSMRTAS